MTIQFKMLSEMGSLPTLGTPGSAAYDLRAAARAIIHPGLIEKIPLGFAMALPLGHCAFILPRSGLATKTYLRPANTPGLVDSDYRGEVIVALENFGTHSQLIEPGDRIAQMLICKLPYLEFEVVPNLPESVRGEGGFGSTGGLSNG